MLGCMVGGSRARSEMLGLAVVTGAPTATPHNRIVLVSLYSSCIYLSSQHRHQFLLFFVFVITRVVVLLLIVDNSRRRR